MKEPVGYKVMSILRDFGAVSDDFLAQKLNRNLLELEPYLQALEGEDLICREDHTVKPTERRQEVG